MRPKQDGHLDSCKLETCASWPKPCQYPNDLPRRPVIIPEWRRRALERVEREGNRAVVDLTGSVSL